MPRILLADEDSDIYVSLKVTLSHVGYEVDVVHTIEDIEKMLDLHQYDCLIMELLLPQNSDKQPVSMDDMRNNFSKIASRSQRPPIILRQCVINADDPWFLSHGAIRVFARPVVNGEILAALEKLNVLTGAKVSG